MPEQADIDAPVPETELHESADQRSRKIVWFVLASVGSAVLSFGYLRVAGGGLDADAKGAFRSVLSALAGYAFFATGLQVAFSAMFFPPRGPSWRLGALRVTAVVIAVGTGLAALGAGLLWLPAGTGRPVIAALAGLYVALSGYAALPRAQLLMRERWGQLAVALCVGSVVKFAAAVASHRSGSLEIVLAGLVLTEAIGVAVAEGLATSARPTSSVAGHHRELRPLAVALVSLGGLGLLGGLDSVIARVRMPAVDADAYAAASGLARPVAFVTTVICWIALPRFISEQYGSSTLRRTLWWSMLVAGASSVGLAVIVGLVPSQLLQLTASDPEALSIGAARLLAVAWGLLGTSSVLVFFHVAQRSRMAFAPWIGGGMLLIGAPMVGDRPIALAALVLAAALTSFIVLLLPAMTRVRPVVHSIQATRGSVALSASHVHDVAMVVPCFNPGPVVLETLDRIAAVLGPITDTFEVIAVSDGSTDGSPALIDAHHRPWLRHIDCGANGGKGRAVRTGFQAARAGVVGFIDADGDLPPEQLPAYVRALADYEADVVVASKRHPDSETSVPRLRRIYSSGFQLLVRSLFRLDIRDTQTGLKLFNREVIEQVLPSLQEDGFALDLELLVAAQVHGFTRIVELPVRLEHQFNSTVSTRSVHQMFVATFRIFWQSRMSLRYVRLAQTFTESADG